MRVCHYIKPNARSETPTRAIWFQPWTYIKKKTPEGIEYGFEFIRMVLGTKDSRTNAWAFTWDSVYSQNDFWRRVDTWTHPKTKTYLWSQEPSIDLPIVEAFTVPIQDGWKLTLAVLPPAPTIVRYRKGLKSLLLLAVSNVWPTPLPICSTGVTTCLHSEKSEKLEPCEHVSKLDNVLNALKTTVIEWWDFLKKNDLGGFSPTAGSQSFRVWRHKYMSHRVLIDCHDDALALSREAVYGARCEVFAHASTSGKVYELDTNGSYGRVMRDMQVPIKLRSYRREFSIRDLCEWVADSVCVAKVDIETDQAVFPLRVPGRFSFAAGKFHTVLAGEALKYALDHGYVRDAYECAVYEHAPAFSDYIQALWNLRKFSESLGLKNDAEKYKLLNNSFWGRWAQHGRVWEKHSEADDLSIKSWVEYNVDLDEVSEWRQFGGIIQRLQNETESRESFPAIAACVIAAGHMQMWRYLAQAGLDNVYYCDTDAVFTNEVGFQRLHQHVNSYELGALKIKGVYDSATFLAQKYVITSAGTRRAGLSQVRMELSEGSQSSLQYQHVAEQIRQSKPLSATMKGVRRGVHQN